MKKILTLVIILLVLVGGYFAFNYYTNLGGYELTLDSELNPADFSNTKTQIRQTSKQYIDDIGNRYGVEVMEYSDEESASESLSTVMGWKNPAKIILDTKYVNYHTESSDSGEISHEYFYQSGDILIFVRSKAEKNTVEQFMDWFFKKYPNKPATADIDGAPSLGSENTEDTKKVELPPSNSPVVNVVESLPKPPALPN